MNPVLAKFLGTNAEDVRKYKMKIEEMMSNYDSYSYAEDTLNDIYEYMLNTNTISEKQMQAIDNIENAPNQYAR